MDLIAGFNGQEGGVALTPIIQGLAATQKKTITGFTNEMCRDVLKKTCNGLTPMSINLCVDFYMHTYNISSAPNDQERGVRLSYVLGKTNFEHNDIGLVISIKQLKQKTVMVGPMVDIHSNFFLQNCNNLTNSLT